MNAPSNFLRLPSVDLDADPIVQSAHITFIEPMNNDEDHPLCRVHLTCGAILAVKADADVIASASMTDPDQEWSDGYDAGFAEARSVLLDEDEPDTDQPKEPRPC